MQHDYTDEEIKTAWRDSLSLRAFLAALPERPQAAEIAKLKAEREKWEADALRYCKNADFWRSEHDKAQAVAAVVTAQAIRRMEAVPVEELEKVYWDGNEAVACYTALKRVRARLIAAAKGEGQTQAKPSTRIEITEIPDKKPGPVGTMAYAPQAEALPSTQQNKSESSALEKQAVQEAAYILNHYDRKSHADHICLGKKLIREGWKGPNFGEQKSDLKLTLHRSAAEDTPQAEAKAEPAKLLGQHGPKGAPALCGPSANPVVVNEPPQNEGQPDLSGESEKQAAAQPWTPAVGDTVRLKSGGPVMTVTHVDPLSLMCAWMNASNELQVEPITTLCLTPAQP